MSKYKYVKIVQAFCKSNYHIAAIGFRECGFDELVGLFKILNKEFDNLKINDIIEEYHKYQDATIEMDKSLQEMNCNIYNEYVCDCWLPDISEPYCQRVRKEKLLENYNSRKRNYPEYNKWRYSVYERDSYTCQNCKQIGGKLNAHHIKSYKDYPEISLDVENGITYCVKCHRQEHKRIYDKKNQS